MFTTSDEQRGEIITAAIKLLDSADETDALKSELKETVRRDLAKYKYPRRIVFVDSFPTTSNGKVSRQSLREQFDTRLTERSS